MNHRNGEIIDFYKLLGVDPDAGMEEIKRAYRSKLKEWHPDKNIDRLQEAEEVTKTLNQAYHMLGDPERRRQYDRMLRYTRGKDFGKLFNESEFWQKVEKASPALKKIMENVRDLYALFRDGIRSQYPVHPATLSIIAGGLIYFIIPLDVIPDYLPLVGYLDDAAVLTAIVNSLQGEILKYRRWREAGQQ
jgi:curved DNA-binding protein CbpA